MEAEKKLYKEDPKKFAAEINGYMDYTDDSKKWIACYMLTKTGKISQEFVQLGTKIVDYNGYYYDYNF
jgi:hypothetical protein